MPNSNTEGPARHEPGALAPVAWVKPPDLSSRQELSIWGDDL